MSKKSSTKDLSLSSNERLYIKNKSLFTPLKYRNLKPEGLKIYTFKAGFKKKFDDLLLIIFDKPINAATVYSKTSTPSAPIIWDKKFNKGKVRALIVNSGNANAHTGEKGIRIINDYVKHLTKLINCKKSEVLVSSTGVIGELFDPNLIIQNISNIFNQKTKGLFDAAKAIMTTDTYPKLGIKRIKIQNISFTIYGVAKGSGMIHPNMGTMLVYIFIDLALNKKILQKLLNNNLDNTFNSISTDGDTSTSDTLVLFSTESNKRKIDFKIINNYNKLNKSILELMSELSLKVVKDGEGISKLIKVNIQKSLSKRQAKNIGFAIVNSPLVKTAISGEDANWGRIIAAIGKTQEKIIQNKIKIYFGKNLVCENGAIYKKININKLDRYMKNKTIEISVTLNMGIINHTVFGNDLTHEYIRINSDYRS